MAWLAAALIPAIAVAALVLIERSTDGEPREFQTPHLRDLSGLDPAERATVRPVQQLPATEGPRLEPAQSPTPVQVATATEEVNDDGSAVPNPTGGDVGSDPAPPAPGIPSATPIPPQAGATEPPQRPEVEVDEPDIPGPVATAAPSIEEIICAFDWPCAEALAVVYGPTPPNDKAPVGCPNGESGGEPGSTHDLGRGRGLFAIHEQWHRARFERRGWTWDDAFDPYRNTAIAHEIYVESGRSWRLWSCRP